MDVAYNNTIEGYFIRELFNESIASIEAFNFALQLYNKAMTEDKVTADEQAAIRRKTLRGYRVGIDQAIARCMIKEFVERMPKEKIPHQLLNAIEECGSAEAFADELFTTTRIIKDYPLTRKEIQNDPFIQFVSWFVPIMEQNRQYAYRNLSNVPAIEKWYKPYMQALRVWDKERAFYPDANFTLRVAYGKIAGYENADGEYHTFLTTLDGIIAKDNPAIYDYNIPQVLRNIYMKKDYGRWAIESNGKTTIPVCFLANNHTSGGNSGSPVINGKGELVGINFDRTWRSTMSDIEFDPEICRNISVDIRFVLFVMDRIGGAEYLFEEMGIK